MKQEGVRVRCEDIIEEIDLAAQVLAGRSHEQLAADRASLRAIERCVEIVSEAVRHRPEHLTSVHPGIPWRSIRGVGNNLRHEYGRVDTRLIWQIESQSLPDLRAAVAAILATLPPNQS